MCVQSLHQSELFTKHIRNKQTNQPIDRYLKSFLSTVLYWEIPYQTVSEFLLHDSYDFPDLPQLRLGVSYARNDNEFKWMNYKTISWLYLHIHTHTAICIVSNHNLGVSIIIMSEGVFFSLGSARGELRKGLECHNILSRWPTQRHWQQ